MPKKIILAAAILASLCTAACDPNIVAPPNKAKAAHADAPPCPDDGPRLPQTGICAGRAYAYLDLVDAAAAAPLQSGCAWTVNETLLPGEEALLYRAMTCNGATTKLGFAGGAHSASIVYETSALFGESAKGQELIRLFGAEPDPHGALKAAIAELPAAEQAECEIQPAAIEGWPKDALVIGPTKAARAKAPVNEPNAFCGALGLNEDESSYWRVKQGFAWFYQLGQEALDFDAASVTIIAKTPDGAWGAKQ